MSEYFCILPNRVAMKAFVPQVTQPWSGSQRSQRRVLRCPIPVRTMRPRTPKKRVRTTVTICATSRDVPNRKQDRSLNVAVLVSGSGRSLENLCEKVEDGSLSGCNMKLVISSKKTAGAIARAEKYSILAKVLRLKDFESDTEAFSEAISNSFDEIEADLVIMAGWMHFYKIPPRYDGKVINIHPSLIPAFCGQGFYGHRVHEAVIKFGAKITGCTVHLADNKYDHGPIILQKAVPVLDSDSPDELATRVFESEKEALPEAVQLFVDRRISVVDGIARIKEISQTHQV